MTSPKTNGEALATPENSESLRMTLETWNKEKLVEQVLAMSQTLAEEQEAVKKITSRYDATQSWALGLALVEEIGQNLASTLDLNEVLTRLLTRSKWQVTAEPLARLLEKLPGLNAPDWLRIARVVLVEAMLNLELAEIRSAAVIAVLETLRKRRDRRSLLQSVVRSVRGMFSLNVLREAEFVELVQSWAEQAGF
jgi:hypothetical protein